MTRPARPEWWPKMNTGAPMTLTDIVEFLHTIRFKDGPILRRVKAEHAKALSFACRNWISPSTPYEHALYRLCLAAIDEAQATPKGCV